MMRYYLRPTSLKLRLRRRNTYYNFEKLNVIRDSYSPDGICTMYWFGQGGFPGKLANIMASR